MLQINTPDLPRFSCVRVGWRGGGGGGLMINLISWSGIFADGVDRLSKIQTYGKVVILQALSKLTRLISLCVYYPQ